MEDKSKESIRIGQKMKGQFFHTANFTLESKEIKRLADKYVRIDFTKMAGCCFWASEKLFGSGRVKLEKLKKSNFIEESVKIQTESGGKEETANVLD